MIAEKGGNNGTENCSTFCANIDNTWFDTSTGTCVAAWMEIHGSSPIVRYNRKYVGCEFTASTITGWDASVDLLRCYCLTLQ